MHYWILILIFTIMDQWSKKIAYDYLTKRGSPSKFGQRFELRLALNTGGFYGIFKNKRKLLLIVSLFTLMFLIFLLYLGIVNEESFSYNFALSLIISGAAGNSIDRLRKGYVIDFLYFKIKNGPIFNFADIFIFLGVLMMIFIELFST